MYGDDDRVRTLINQLCIADRLIPSNYNEDFDYLKEVNYKKYEEELANMKNFSQNTLLRGINNDNKA